jgi:DNA-binding response OmpR family regulator
VDVHIGRLRRKLGSAGHYVITVRNVGFRFDILPEWLTSNSSG